eukprot:Amastigsp_a841700_941.p1 type:complete len:267 gc:universal Amastigsp_a841700_941:975-175(-)
MTSYSGADVSEQILDEPLGFSLNNEDFDAHARTLSVETLAPLLPGVSFVRDMLSAAECETIIATGFDIRDCTHPVVWRKWAADPAAEEAKVGRRTIFKDAVVAAQLWHRVRPFVPSRVVTVSKGLKQVWEAIGLSDRLKFVQYQAGQDFPAHVDGAKVEADDVRSQISVLFYLDSTDGGQLQFLQAPNSDLGMGAASKAEPTFITEITPERGMCMWFSHKPYLHQSAPVIKGRKFCIRTDVMFRRVSSEPTEEDAFPEARPFLAAD